MSADFRAQDIVEDDKSDGEVAKEWRVPVTIVTGFLGSGKTTLLKHILSGSHGKRVAVIENEFGNEEGIERLIARDDILDTEESIDMGELFVELKNGCICCSVRDDLVVTLENLLTIRSRFDHIVIETTGVADPGPLVGIFWLDEELDSQLYLDGVITVVDSLNLAANLDDPRKKIGDKSSFVNEAWKQIAYADRVLLNKRDMVSLEQMSIIKSRVSSINPFASAFVTKFCECELADIFDVRGYQYVHEMKPSSLQSKMLELEKDSSYYTSPPEADEHENNKQLSHHDPSVIAHVVRSDRPLNVQKLQQWIGQLLWEPESQSTEIFRLKGYLSVCGSDCVHIVQGVHQTFEIEPSRQKWGGGDFVDRQSRCVFIGRGLNSDELLAGLESCI